MQDTAHTNEATKEEAFDRDMFPLLVELQALAREHEIPMLCMFQLDTGPPPGEAEMGADDAPLIAGASYVPESMTKDDRARGFSRAGEFLQTVVSKKL